METHVPRSYVLISPSVICYVENALILKKSKCFGLCDLSENGRVSFYLQSPGTTHDALVALHHVAPQSLQTQRIDLYIAG